MTDEHAMKVWQEACGAYEDNSHDLTLSIRERTIAGDQAAAAIIAADRAELVERVKVLEGENARLQAALREAVDVYEGMCDDEIDEELLPRLRAALKDTSHD